MLSSERNTADTDSFPRPCPVTVTLSLTLPLAGSTADTLEGACARAAPAKNIVAARIPNFLEERVRAPKLLNKVSVIAVPHWTRIGFSISGLSLRQNIV